VDTTPRPCQTRPADWWEYGDAGNRLAVLLCAVCPGCLFPASCRPAGVIVAGRAYDDDGQVHALCECGYPAEAPADRHLTSTSKQLCPRCKLPDISLWRGYILRRHHAGHRTTDIARWIPFSYEHVRLTLAKWLREPALEAQPA
jgi:hypothetical protein